MNVAFSQRSSYLDPHFWLSITIWRSISSSIDNNTILNPHCNPKMKKDDVGVILTKLDRHLGV